MTLTASSDVTFSVIRLQCRQRTYKRLTSQAFNSLFIFFEAASSRASIFFCDKNFTIAIAADFFCSVVSTLAFALARIPLTCLSFF
jgi:hypothetical protein